MDATYGPPVTAHPTVVVVQARMGSTRLPGKVLQDIEGRPLLAWTVAGVQAISSVMKVVVATTIEPQDDVIADLASRLGVDVHRGSVDDVLSRCYDAVASSGAEVVIRQTADNPFPDPRVAAAQAERLVEGGFDYVGIGGWPLGIAAEVCRFTALETAEREASDPTEREHVMPFLYRRPDRFRIGRLDRTDARRRAGAPARFTVDTAADLAFARALAGRLGHGPPVSIDELERLVDDDPALLELNAGIQQRSVG